MKSSTLLTLIALMFAIAACGAPAPTAPATAAPTQVPPTQPAATEPTAGPPAAATPPGSSIQGYPAPPSTIPDGVLPAARSLGSYVALAWNNLGMHCFQSDYSQFLILPPYNVLWTQVVQRGGEDPSIVRSGVAVNYRLPQVTQPQGHTNFWQYASAYGWTLAPGVGLTGKTTSGAMDAAGDHFIAEGVPVVDVNDSGTWDPYPFFVVDVQAGNQTVAQTVNVAPASTEMSCHLCHAGNTIPEVYAGILQTHDRNNGTALAQQAQQGTPVVCNACHADAAMGVMQSQGSKFTLSGAMHIFHADKMTGSQLPTNTCQACHPGPQTQCLRDAMSAAGTTCTDCHGTMQDVGDPARTPWVNLPTCQSCHGTNLGRPTGSRIDNPNQHLTASTGELYRESKAHGGGGIYCAACHGSPHAIYPTTTDRDNQQSIRLQGSAGTITRCEVCHAGGIDEGFWHFGGGD